MGELPPLRAPTMGELREYSSAYGLALEDEHLEHFQDIMEDIVENYRRVDQLDAPTPSQLRPGSDRDSGYVPDGSEDPFNAYVTKCHINTAETGPLAEKTVALKDNISLADVPMTLGSVLFEEYVPAIDSTIVSRLLDAGATINGKTNLDDMALGATGEAPHGGPVLNPRDSDHLAGGSSGGSAAAVVANDADIAIGTDQGGSCRIPAAWCGCVGLKPTHGLVPYTGIANSGHTFDHAGPLARTVADCALALDVIAGPDGLDPRQRRVSVRSYAEGLDDATVEGLRIGVLEEGFGRVEAGSSVDRTVRDALDRVSDDGGALEEVSVPMHVDGATIRSAFAIGERKALVDSEGLGRHYKGYYDTEFLRAFARARRRNPEDLPPKLKLRILLGEHMEEWYWGYYHAKAQNLRREVTAAYDEALETVDALALPTTPDTAHPVRDDFSRRDRSLIDHPVVTGLNTAPTSASGHPAISIPCGSVEGLPVGLMLIGRRYREDHLLEVAAAIEGIVG